MKRLNQSGSFHFLLLIIPLVVIVEGFAYWRITKSTPKVSSLSEVTCGSTIAKKIVTANKLDPLHGCTRTTIDTKVGSFVLLEFNYGEGQDCPSGCITKNYVAMVDEKGTYHPYQDGALSKDVLEKAYGCAVSNEDAKNLLKTHATLMHSGKSYAWQTSFDDELITDPYDNICRLNGTITTYFPDAIPKNQTDTAYKLTVSYPEIYGCRDNNTIEGQAVSCVSRLALLSNDVTLCNKTPIDVVSGSTASTGRSRRRECVTAVAGKTQETKVCEQINTISKSQAAPKDLEHDVIDCYRAINSLRTEMGKPEQL